MESNRKIVIAITGASGSIYAQEILKKLIEIKQDLADVALILSKNAQDIWKHELNNNFLDNLPFKTWSNNDFYAPFASGSSFYDTLIVIPCSMGTLGRIAAGISDDLITRTADVMLKERRKLILVPRETPLSLIHLQNMLTLTQAGGIICPGSPSFYSNPNTIQDLVLTVVNRILHLANLKTNGYVWGEHNQPD